MFDSMRDQSTKTSQVSGQLKSGLTQIYMNLYSKPNTIMQFYLGTELSPRAR